MFTSLPAPMKPYIPKTSAKTSKRTSPKKNRGCLANPLTPTSPMAPIAQPEAKHASPTDSPAPKCKLPAKRESGSVGLSKREIKIATTIP